MDRCSMIAIASCLLFLVSTVTGQACTTCPPGPPGLPGYTGPQGLPGPTGPKGEPGLKGQKGIMGLKGNQGPTGNKGVKGDRGPIGLAGNQGPMGIKGQTGSQGPTGNRGLKGNQGLMGLKGDMGLKGLKGDKGLQGPPGLPGSVGPIGLVGPVGSPGLDGLPYPQETVDSLTIGAILSGVFSVISIIVTVILSTIGLIWIIVKIFKKPNKAVTNSGIHDPIEMKQNSVYSTHIKHNQDRKGTQHNYETVDTSSEELPKKRTRPPAYTNVSLQPGDTERVYNCVQP